MYFYTLSIHNNIDTCFRNIIRSVSAGQQMIIVNLKKIAVNRDLKQEKQYRKKQEVHRP